MIAPTVAKATEVAINATQLPRKSRDVLTPLAGWAVVVSDMNLHFERVA
jgi:hypothetical protein